MDTNARSGSLEALRQRTGIGRWNPQQQSEAWIFLLPGLAGFIIFILGVLTVIGTLISDILLAMVDPRIKFGS